MDTGNFAACVEVQEQAIRDHKPDLVIGSSFGGAVVARCLERGSWKGPTLLLAAAVRRLDPELVLPRGVPVWIVHGLDDAVIDPEDSRHLAATGRPEDVRLIETNDDHSLHSWVKSGQFVDLVREILETRNG
jgi:alpha/beta superfamily hydrolase